jgi:phosphatidylglycerol:prolipoprotein diacylglycerol transferase
MRAKIHRGNNGFICPSVIARVIYIKRRGGSGLAHSGFISFGFRISAFGFYPCPSVSICVHLWLVPAVNSFSIESLAKFQFSIFPHPFYLPAVHPIAFHLGSLTIRWYGIMMAVAFFAGLWTATRRARLVNVSGDTITDVTLWLMAGSIIGARIVYVTTYWKRQFADQPWSEVFMIQHGGLVYYGGLIGATLASAAYLSRKKLPLWTIADVLAPSIALGSVFGRIGCLLNGCCYGRVCHLPWAITFTNPQAEELSGTPLNSPRHPTEVYDALLNLALYAILAWAFRRKRRFDGQIFALYLLGYAVCRSTVEFFRGDYPPDHIYAGMFTSAQLLSVPIFVAGLVLWFLLARRPHTPPPQR